MTFRKSVCKLCGTQSKPRGTCECGFTHITDHAIDQIVTIGSLMDEMERKIEFLMNKVKDLENRVK